MTFFSYDVLNFTLIKNISKNNEECNIITVIININSDEPLFYIYSIELNKYSGTCNNINDPYLKLCVPGVVKI